MVITVKGSTSFKPQLKIECRDPRFADKFGMNTLWTSRSMLFANMRRIAHWCDTIGEECYFEAALKLESEE